MKFSEYPYARPDIAALKQEFTDIAAAIKAAASAQETAEEDTSEE